MMYLTMLETAADKVIFEKLYEKNGQKLHFIARKVLNDEMDAEDAVHNGFLKLANSFAKYRNKPYEDLERICTIIVRNAAIDIFREKSKTCRFSEKKGFSEENVPDIVPNILDKVIEQRDSAIIDEALKEMEYEEREFLYLQYAAGFKPKEIGEMFHMTSAEVRKKNFVSRNKLAEILKNKGFDDYTKD